MNPDPQVVRFPSFRLKSVKAAKMAASNESIFFIRALLHELRKTIPEKPLHENLAVRYLLSEARKHQTTEKRLCRAHKELQGRAATYLCYLTSSRKARVRLCLKPTHLNPRRRVNGTPVTGRRVATLSEVNEVVVNR